MVKTKELGSPPKLCTNHDTVIKACTDAMSLLGGGGTLVHLWSRILHVKIHCELKILHLVYLLLFFLKEVSYNRRKGI